MKEEWRPVVGYEGLYEVSNMGRVKSVERTAWNGKGYRIVAERILKGRRTKKGYLQVQLHQDAKIKPYYIHRLVAQSFLDNPDNLPEVNHIDQDKTNNCIDNLEWCTSQYNIEYSQAKPVIGIDKITGLILEFSSAHEVERMIGIAQQSICACLKGRQKSAGGFYWYYADSDI